MMKAKGLDGLCKNVNESSFSIVQIYSFSQYVFF